MRYSEWAETANPWRKHTKPILKKCALYRADRLAEKELRKECHFYKTISQIVHWYDVTDQQEVVPSLSAPNSSAQWDRSCFLENCKKKSQLYKFPNDFSNMNCECSAAHFLDSNCNHYSYESLALDGESKCGGRVGCKGGLGEKDIRPLLSVETDPRPTNSSPVGLCHGGRTGGRHRNITEQGEVDELAWVDLTLAIMPRWRTSWARRNLAHSDAAPTARFATWPSEQRW
jgi:hypothetical protein